MAGAPPEPGLGDGGGPGGEDSPPGGAARGPHQPPALHTALPLTAH